MNRLRDSLRTLLFRRRFEREMVDELQFHLEEAEADLIRRGVAPAEARRRARAGFGAIDGVKDEARDARGVQWLDELRGDLRAAVRTLRRSPGYAIVAIVTLGLGIGANTTIFSVIDGVLLSPLPFPDSDRLVRITAAYPNGALPIYRRDAVSYQGVGAYAYQAEVNLLIGDEPERVSGRAVSPGLFQVLGVAPIHGRTFRAGEDEPAAAPVALVSEGLWRRRLGADPAAIGRTIVIDGVPRELVGVLPGQFSFPTPGTEVWIPILLDPGNPSALWFSSFSTFVGRLRDGVSIAAADGEHQALIPRIRGAFPWRMPDTWGTSGDNHVRPLGAAMGAALQGRLFLLFGAVGLVLLVACVNVANLNLTRLAGRGREIAIRQAIGGTRFRVARQLLVEQLVIAGLGGAAGVGLAALGTPLLVRWLPTDTPRLDQVGLDGRVLAFTAAAALLAALLAATAPVLRIRRVKRVEVADLTGRRAGPARQRLAGSLVVAEVALAVLLVTGAGLTLRSLAALLSIDPGIRTEQVVTARVTPNPARCSTEVESCHLFYASLLDRIRGVPGVRDAAAGTTVPLDGRAAGFAMAVEDHPVQPGGDAWMLDGHVISPAFLGILGIRVEEGRAFTAQDRLEGAPVALVSRSTADRFWPGQSALGKTIKPVWRQPWITIVGVVSDVRFGRLDEPPRLDFYLPVSQWPAGSMTLLLRSDRPPASMEPALREALAAVDPTAPLSRIGSMDRIVKDSVASPRTTATLLALFAAVGLVLGGIGIYGVLSYRIAHRRREIGIRMAVGADPRAVRHLVVGQAARLIGGGVLIGLAGAWTGAELLRSFVSGIDVRDPTTFALVPLVFALVGLGAAYLPARRATRVSPTETLKAE